MCDQFCKVRFSKHDQLDLQRSCYNYAQSLIPVNVFEGRVLSSAERAAVISAGAGSVEKPASDHYKLVVLFEHFRTHAILKIGIRAIMHVI